ncbi:phosphonate C-P lyase system protein PhnG [Sneathiella sp. P13V-1]|uniref:phosphonate C-P lyase system protein PhnG n=1 Tax=Sneathiella sp. P13V-1 TaxID=2697366 RepID=UPI00187B9D67|nr:phosphonate C-P lyase system protein PhnG [Sneathiella sp. P13V-1]MBE7638630.1 phosphonate C-P lyase system protein PhnG [Sneathiella sp. P13V-1]
MSSADLTPAQQARQNWMGILARSSVEELENELYRNDETPNYSFLREPEIGLVMVRGRAGGTGSRFNLGEMTVSRCSVSLEGGTIGHGYVKGRNRRHAELIAVFDALFIEEGAPRPFVAELAEKQSNVKKQKSVKAAATKVDFYTMVRGED